MSDYSVSSDDQLWAQNFTIIDSRGRSITFNMPELDSYQLYGQRLAINYATQFGASFVMLLALLLATRAERRNSFVFLVNVITLAFNTVRSILCACFTTSGFWSPYFQITNDGIGITKSDRATNATALVMGILVTGLVYASLSMQVWTVCAITPRPQRLIIIFITTAVSLAAMGLKIATTIAVIKANLDYRPMDPDDKLTQASPALQLVAIWLFSFIFTLKLGFAIVRRRRLNMRQFGPMQIVFIMGCQTMLVPGMLRLITSSKMTLTMLSCLQCTTILWTSRGIRYAWTDYRLHFPTPFRHVGRYP